MTAETKPFLMGWCQGAGHHEACRVEIGGTGRTYRCQCSCHEEAS